MKNKIVAILIFFLFANMSFSQTKNIYILKHRYNQKVRNSIDKSNISFKDIYVMTSHKVDPKKNGNINYNEVDKYLNKWFPEKNTEGVLCLDLENKSFKDIRDNTANNQKYKKGIESFVKLIKYIRLSRPNLKLGVYGMPFRMHSKSHVKRNGNKKLDPVLKLTDYIFPSIYVFYPAKQKGIKYNIDYFDNNLNMSFEYAERLNKKVVPFVWYMLHPSNKRFNNEIIPRSEMREYINYLENYKSPQDLEIDGIVWWDSPTTFAKGRVRNNLLNDPLKGVFRDINESFQYYFNVEK